MKEVKIWKQYHLVDYKSMCDDAYITSSSSQSTLESVDQRIFSLATESSTEVIQVQSPHHGSSKTTLLQPLNL